MKFTTSYGVLFAAVQFTSAAFGSFLQFRNELSNGFAGHEAVIGANASDLASPFSGTIEARDICSNGAVDCGGGNWCDQCSSCCGTKCSADPYGVCCDNGVSSCDYGEQCWKNSAAPFYGCCPTGTSGCWSGSAWNCCNPGATCSSGVCVGTASEMVIFTTITTASTVTRYANATRTVTVPGSGSSTTVVTTTSTSTILSTATASVTVTALNAKRDKPVVARIATSYWIDTSFIWSTIQSTSTLTSTITSGQAGVLTSTSVSVVYTTSWMTTTVTSTYHPGSSGTTNTATNTGGTTTTAPVSSSTAPTPAPGPSGGLSVGAQAGIGAGAGAAGLAVIGALIAWLIMRRRKNNNKDTPVPETDGGFYASGPKYPAGGMPPANPHGPTPQYLAPGVAAGATWHEKSISPVSTATPVSPSPDPTSRVASPELDSRPVSHFPPPPQAYGAQHQTGFPVAPNVNYHELPSSRMGEPPVEMDGHMTGR